MVMVKKIAAIIIKYPEAIQESALALNTFTVEGKQSTISILILCLNWKENYKSTAKGLHNGAPQIDTTVGSKQIRSKLVKRQNSQSYGSRSIRCSGI